MADKKIQFKPVEDYKMVYEYLQAFNADFEFNEEQPIEKAKLIDGIYFLSKNLYEKYCVKMLKDNNISDKDLVEYFNQLMLELLK